MTACRPKANSHDNGQHSIFVQYFEHLLCELRNDVYTCVKTIVCKCMYTFVKVSKTYPDLRYGRKSI